MSWLQENKDKIKSFIQGGSSNYSYIDYMNAVELLSNAIEEISKLDERVNMLEQSMRVVRKAQNDPSSHKILNE